MPRENRPVIPQTLAAAGLLAILIACSARATPLDELIAPEKDNVACFQRVYDSAHLAAHPRQTVTAVVVWLRYEAMRDSDKLALDFGIGMSRRGDRTPFFQQGDCDWDEQGNKITGGRRLVSALNQDAAAVCMMYARPDVFEAVSAQEGGYLMFDRGKDRETLALYLDDGMIMVKRANRDDQINVKFGAEDREFLLRRTETKNCAAVERAVTEPEPGVAPRQR